MSLGKLLAVVFALILGGLALTLLMSSEPEIYDPPEVPVVPSGKTPPESYQLGAFSADSGSFPVLVVGEHDLVIESGALDEYGRGWIWTDTGTTGLTGGDLFDLQAATGSDGVIATARLEASATGPEPRLYAERLLDDVAIGRYDDSGIEVERQLGSVLIRALGETMDPLIIGSMGPVAVFRGPTGGAVVALDASLTVGDGGELSIEGTTEIGALLDLLGSLAEADRAGPHQDGRAVTVTGVTVEVYRGAGADDPLELAPSEVDGAFRVESRPQLRIPGAWGTLPKLMNTDPQPRGAGVLVLFDGLTVEAFD